MNVRFEFKAFSTALQFLTRCPLPPLEIADSKVYGRSIIYYPLVGLLLGLLLLICAGALSNTAVPLQAALILLVWISSTGALHLDGLADCADAWAGGLGDRDKTLAIMKDPAAGPVAVVVLVTVLMVKWAALGECLRQAQYLVVLLTPLAGRLAILALMLTTRYVRRQGLAENILAGFHKQSVIGVLLAGCIIIGLGTGGLSLLTAVIIIYWLRQTANARIGGATGDLYGASVELVETAVITVAVL